MLHKGPISRLVHGVFEYAVGLVLVAGPVVMDFDDGAAKAVSVVLGVLVLTLAASTEGVTGLIDQIALQAHAVLDFVVAGVLVASPFVFGFSGDAEPTALFLVLGVVHLLVSVGTRYLPGRAPGSGDSVQ